MEFTYCVIALFWEHLCQVEKGRAWVSDPAAARSENVALPFLFAWFVSFDAKKYSIFPDTSLTSSAKQLS